MARTLLVLDEVLAMLKVVGVADGLVAKFKVQAEGALQHKARGHAPDTPDDAITVSSGFGQASQRGFVELTLNEQLSQMPASKAREVGLMLLQAAEAATSDEIVVGLLKKIGLTDPAQYGAILMDLRELRQGTRDVLYPS